MKCKKHPCDLSSSVGLCASCLRERLLALIAGQAPLGTAHSPASVLEESRQSDSQSHPPPLLFPRSVSPYVARRKSDDPSSSYHHLRFYSTPQVGPTYTSSSATNTTTFTISRSYKKKPTGFALLSNLFRSRSNKSNPNLNHTHSSDPSTYSIDTPSSSLSWFSPIFSIRQRNRSSLCSVVECPPSVARAEPRRRTTYDRGMSPVRDENSDADCGGNCCRSPSGSGNSSEEEEEERKRVAPAAATWRGKAAAGHVRNASGLAFCLSPLVRASPNRHWNQKGRLPPDLGFSGEIRAPAKPPLSMAASFCANRSRKIADFGKANHKR